MRRQLPHAVPVGTTVTHADASVDPATSPTFTRCRARRRRRGSRNFKFERGNGVADQRPIMSNDCSQVRLRCPAEQRRALDAAEQPRLDAPGAHPLRGRQIMSQNLPLLSTDARART
jgi:hypothetical protein